MVKKLYVGNLPFTATEDEVRSLFEKYGDVHTVTLINDRETGRPRGFGFVEMEDNHADEAAAALDGHDFGGRNLRVNQAREHRGGGGGGGGRRGGQRQGGGRSW
ncbi:MAG: RNA recognition motif domain-containing protein [Planctomycetota bacterium]